MNAKNNTQLSKSMTEEQFDKGYWYADEIKMFAKDIGIENTSVLRKDELEMLIKEFLQTGKVKNSNRKNLLKSGQTDIEKGLHLSLPIVNYTSNKLTKNFILTEAVKIAQDMKVKSGAWYRLNRWRDEQMNKNNKTTYKDLIQQFIKLNQTSGNFEKIPVGRYINFLADYLANEKNATRENAISEWKELKTLNIFKDYKSWKQYKQTKKNNKV